MATEDWQVGWAAIGEAAAQAHLGEIEDSIGVLESLLTHTDPEVRMEASLRRSRARRRPRTGQGRDSKGAEPSSGDCAGPGLGRQRNTGPHTRALIGAGDPDGARAAWRALAARWPQEEAQLPAWLALSQLSIDLGEKLTPITGLGKPSRRPVTPATGAKRARWWMRSTTDSASLSVFNRIGLSLQSRLLPDTIQTRHDTEVPMRTTLTPLILLLALGCEKKVVKEGTGGGSLDTGDDIIDDDETPVWDDNRHATSVNFMSAYSTGTDLYVVTTEGQTWHYVGGDWSTSPRASMKSTSRGSGARVLERH